MFFFNLQHTVFTPKHPNITRLLFGLGLAQMLVPCRKPTSILKRVTKQYTKVLQHFKPTECTDLGT